MTKYLLLILLSFFVSCKKEIPKLVATSKPAIEVLKNGKPTIPIDTSQIHKFRSESLTAFYQSNHNKTVWTSPDRRKTLISILGKAYEEGLDPDDYVVAKLKRYEEKINSLSDRNRAEYDLLLTSSLQKYISHLANGKMNPRKLYTNWDLAANKIDGNKTATKLLRSDSMAKQIELLKPNHIVYKSLKKALQIITDFPKDDFKRIEIAGLITQNDTNPALVEIKKRLIYWNDLKPKDSLSSVYDEETTESIRKFQNRHGLAIDGIIGPRTVESLNFSKRQRREQIIANLERWKWFPREMGNEHIIINIPDYRLTLIKNKDTLRTHRVIVGRPKRQTPVLSSKLTQVIFNPTWTVPPTIIREDLIPDVLRNRNYFTEMNIKIYDANGNIVSPNKWRLSRAYSYRYVQVPGIFNSLGMVKLVFPNRFSIYLHDTNHRDFFEKLNRSLSSGCVRVDNPLELTEYLLDDPVNWNLEKITATLQNEKTEYAMIRKKVAFHLLYWTAWSEKNALLFRDDIYSLDADLYNQLGN